MSSKAVDLNLVHKFFMTTEKVSLISIFGCRPGSGKTQFSTHDIPLKVYSVPIQ